MKRMGLVMFLVLVGACARTEDVASTNTDTAPTAAAVPSNTDTGGAAQPDVPAADLEFATTASMANLYEILSGELANGADRGSKYKEFAHTMVTQHNEIKESYVPIAQAQSLPMPTELAGQFKDLYDALAATKDAKAFDTLYKQQMIQTHTDAVALFKKEAETGQDAQLKAFAAKWLPTVEHHLEMAKALPNA